MGEWVPTEVYRFTKFPLTSFLLLSVRHLERLRQLNHTIELRIPTLRRKVTAVEITASGNFVATISESQQPASGNVDSRWPMITSQAGHVHKRCTPALIYV